MKIRLLRAKWQLILYKNRACFLKISCIEPRSEICKMPSFMQVFLLTHQQDLAQLNINLRSRMKICTDFTLVSLHIVTVSTDDHSLLDHLVWCVFL